MVTLPFDEVIHNYYFNSRMDDSLRQPLFSFEYCCLEASNHRIITFITSLLVSLYMYLRHLLHLLIIFHVLVHEIKSTRLEHSTSSRSVWRRTVSVPVSCEEKWKTKKEKPLKVARFSASNLVRELLSRPSLRYKKVKTKAQAWPGGQ